MERFQELAINLKSFPFQERDRIVVFLTEHQGKKTGIARGGHHSKRYGGALDVLTCSTFSYVEKPHGEMVRIEEAIVYKEFRLLSSDFERMSVASFAAEFCLKLIEPNTPVRDIFVLLSHVLFQLDQGADPWLLLNAFLTKALHTMGYPPLLLRCSKCGKPAHEVESERFFWDRENGGMVCGQHVSNQSRDFELSSDLLLFFHDLTTASFREITEKDASSKELQQKLWTVLKDFLLHHVPGMPKDGLNSLQFLKV